MTEQLDACGYPEGVAHPHVEQCHRAERATVLRELEALAWTPRTGTVEDDLRSRLACVIEATYWDRPYDERIAAIRGMCDLTTNGMTPAPVTDADPT